MSHGVEIHVEIYIQNSVLKCVHGQWNSQRTWARNSSVARPASQSTRQPACQPTSQSASEPACQPVNQPASQPVLQPQPRTFRNLVRAKGHRWRHMDFFACAKGAACLNQKLPQQLSFNFRGFERYHAAKCNRGE